MDDLVARKSVEWRHRAEFIARNFETYTRMNVDPTSACFLDGSVLSNRPFREAISAIRGRPAYRQVDRRLVYIDPDPRRQAPRPIVFIPGFFSTLKAALSDLPSAERLTDELNWVNNFNDRINRLREIIEDARPQVRPARLLTSARRPRSGSRLRPNRSVRGANESMSRSRPMPGSPTKAMSASSLRPSARLYQQSESRRCARSGAIAVRPCHRGNYRRLGDCNWHGLWQGKTSGRASRNGGGTAGSSLGEVSAGVRR